MFRPLILVLATLFPVAMTSAQQASFTPFGVPCTFPGEPTPAIGSRGLPQLGTTFDVTYQGPNRNTSAAQQRIQPFLVTGLSAFPAPVPVPAGIFPQQQAGCFVFIFPDFVVPMPLARSGRTYESSVSLTIPNDVRLLGATWFHQWFALFVQCGIAGCDPFWAVTSDAARVVAGN